MVELLPILTFGNLSAVDNVMDSHTGRVGVTPKKAGIYFIIGVLCACLLFNSVPLLVKLYVVLKGLI